MSSLSMHMYPSSSPSTTWLTADEKIALMKEFKHAELNGFLDADSFKCLWLLNTIPGIMSEFSCAGHADREFSAGYLALRISRKIAEILDKNVIDSLWKDNLIFVADKEWQPAIDSAGQLIPRMRYTLRFSCGMISKVCEALYHYINKEL